MKDCIDNANEVVKYFKNMTVVHGLLDRAREHVKVRITCCRCQGKCRHMLCQAMHSDCEDNGCCVVIYIGMSSNFLGYCCSATFASHCPSSPAGEVLTGCCIA